mmetsp:Transcript_17205/g.26636  ORF Transcript_17205/g.26636 Transcript_17205/m.26636 type:complete len:718 (-) Transcript_17205:109-2262(-)|eukprot:CAMPEP_0195283914 /NCGR_PEP_ID=MMETSP0707-20130614/2298_1 /TAXON_ID=33640 /ORGANISM="Asterionellopsis glacialis, Strain CCMP134" /LENGTH=717 /DNA_ID=CAMNT_0040343167 /DNA_START=87 /DNA_END=2240 /DNA_ORIENTATION=-
MGNKPTGGDSSGFGDGNTTSSRPTNVATAFGRRTGTLGLSKPELERRCKPSGLYPSVAWEEKAIRKLIADGKLAARLKGNEVRTSPTDCECPICFLQYSQVNITQCCQAYICTECYLQVRPQKEKNATCPFCNNAKLIVSVARKMDAEDVQKREEEEQRTIEATIRARTGPTDSALSSSPKIAAIEGKNSDGKDGANNENDNADMNSSSNLVPPLSSSPGGFGSFLEQDDVVRRMRARSESLSSDTSFGGGGGLGGTLNSSAASEEQLLRQLSLSSEDRQRLENQMKAQHTHPLARRIEAEAEERRLNNEIEYHLANYDRAREARVSAAAAAAGLGRHRSSGSSSSGRSGRLHGAIGDSGMVMEGQRRDWNQIVDAFERGGNGTISSLDDLVVLEAALILSMEQENQRRTASSSTAGGDQGSEETTILGSDRAQASATTRSSSGFDATAHALAGFPLVQDLVSNRGYDGNVDEESASTRSGTASNTFADRDFLNNPAIRLERRNHLLRNNRTLLRGVTEDEQMAMAIALSLRESEADSSNAAAAEEEGSTGGDEGNNADNSNLNNAAEEGSNANIESTAESYGNFVGGQRPSTSLGALAAVSEEGSNVTDQNNSTTDANSGLQVDETVSDHAEQSVTTEAISSDSDHASATSAALEANEPASRVAQQDVTTEDVSSDSGSPSVAEPSENPETAQEENGDTNLIGDENDNSNGAPTLV